MILSRCSTLRIDDAANNSQEASPNGVVAHCARTSDGGRSRLYLKVPLPPHQIILSSRFCSTGVVCETGMPRLQDIHCGYRWCPTQSMSAKIPGQNRRDHSCRPKKANRKSLQPIEQRRPSRETSFPRGAKGRNPVSITSRASSGYLLSTGDHRARPTRS